MVLYRITEGSPRGKRMNKEQLQPLLAKRSRWFQSPTCPLSEWYWSQFLLSMHILNQPLEPVGITVSTDRGESYDVWAIVKNYNRSQPTRLIIDPFPGMLVNLENHVIRPLLVRPVFVRDFHTMLQTVFSQQLGQEHTPTWYMDGMKTLLASHVDHSIDDVSLVQTMQTFQQEFRPRFP